MDTRPYNEGRHGKPTTVHHLRPVTLMQTYILYQSIPANGRSGREQNWQAEKASVPTIALVSNTAAMTRFNILSNVCLFLLKDKLQVTWIILIIAFACFN